MFRVKRTFEISFALTSCLSVTNIPHNISICQCYIRIFYKNNIRYIFYSVHFRQLKTQQTQYLCVCCMICFSVLRRWYDLKSTIKYIFFYARRSSRFVRTALMNSSLFNTVGSSNVVINARSFVIFPLSMMERVACSSLSAKPTSSGI